jgi:methyl-accepting chemotaxis protein
MREERTKVWIDNFQTKLFVRMGWYWLIYQVSLWNLVFVWRLLQEGPGNLLEQYGRFWLDNAPALVGCLALLPILAWDAVKFAHRVVGPIYRFRQTMRAVAAGEAVRPIKLRQGDFLIEMQDDFNTMLEKLQRQGVPVLAPTEVGANGQRPQPV